MLERYMAKSMHRPVLVIDIDVTIADGSHRIHLLKEYCARCGSAGKVLEYNGHEKPEASFCPNCDHDVFTTPLSSWVDFTNPSLLALDEPIRSAQVVLAKASKTCDIHYITGRQQDSRKVTEEWLTEHFGFDPKVNKLLMRKENSYTERRGVNHLPASLHKQDCFAKLMKECGYSEGTLFMFFEDDLSALNMYSQYGLVFKAPECWALMDLPPAPVSELIYAR